MMKMKKQKLLMLLAVTMALVLATLSANARAADVDAGVDMITWSDEPVMLDSTILIAGDILWTADDPNIIFDPAVNPADPNTSDVEDPTVTITKQPGGGGEVTIIDPVDIVVPNQGFEDRIMADGSFGWWRTSYNPNSWCGADPDGSGAGEYESYLFQWNPGLDAIVGNWTDNGYGGEAPEGQNVVVVDNYDSGLAQLLTETFDHTKAYQLTAKVANSTASAWDGWWEGYGLELLVGGTKNLTTTYGTIEGGTSIAYIEENETECGFDDDTFYPVSLTYIPDAADAGLDGQPLQIRVMSHSDDGYAIFDDVKLVKGDDYTSGGPGAKVVTLTLDVAGEQDTIQIDVYDTQCDASIAAVATPLAADRDGDCIVSLGDFAEIAAEWLDGSDLAELAEMAEEWLEDINIDGPVPKP